MNSHYNPQLIEEIKSELLVLDNNVLSSLASDHDYLKEFLKIFKNNILLIDPTVKIELLRGAFKIDAYNELLKFLEFQRFDNMVDNVHVLQSMYKNAIDIARVYSHHDNPSIPLGDLLITARLSIYHFDVLFLTRDKGDFGTLLFDRLGVVSIERKFKKKDGIDHINIFRFNHSKLSKCLKSLPSK